MGETFRQRPVLYVAGPYTRPDPVINTHAACQVGLILFEQTEWVPMVPHITLAWHLATPKPIDFWYELDIYHMLRCDAIVRLPGASSGADRELAVAIDHGLKVVDFLALPEEAVAAWEASR